MIEWRNYLKSEVLIGRKRTSGANPSICLQLLSGCHQTCHQSIKSSWTITQDSLVPGGGSHGMRRWFLWRKMYHVWLLDFLDGLGGGNDPLNFQNRAIGGFWENARFIRSNGRKTTFEWPKVVSEVNVLTFWGVIRSLKVVSVFRFGDRKCPFEEIAIHAFLRNFENRTTVCVFCWYSENTRNNEHWTFYFLPFIELL